MTRDQMIFNNMVALARRRKGKRKGSARSQMLRMIMPMLSQENGERLARAIQKKDTNLMRQVWDDIKQQLANKLAVEASADGKTFEDIFEGIFDDIFSEQEKPLTSESANRDVSRLIVGNSQVQEMTRELVANGFTEYTDANGDNYEVIIRNISVTTQGRPQPKMRITAEVKGPESTTITATGEYASACSELVVSALAISESD